MTGTTTNDMQFIDTHVHFGRTVTRLPIKEQSPEQYLAAMSDRQIVAVFAAPVGGFEMSDGLAATRRRNDSIAAQCSRWPTQYCVALGILELRLGVTDSHFNHTSPRVRAAVGRVKHRLAVAAGGTARW